MKIDNHNRNIRFGHRVSTRLLLKAGTGKMSFDDAKSLNGELGVMYSGHIGFHKRAIEIAKKAADTDKNLAKIFDELKNTPKDDLESQIGKYTTALGEKIDINV